MTEKTPIIAIIFILICIILGYLLYRVFFIKPVPTTTLPEDTIPTSQIGEQLPTAGESTDITLLNNLKLYQNLVKFILK